MCWCLVGCCTDPIGLGSGVAEVAGYDCYGLLFRLRGRQDSGWVELGEREEDGLSVGLGAASCINEVTYINIKK
jgi:hypothetical protein